MLHALAQGGYIQVLRNAKGRLDNIKCFNREGWVMPQCTLLLFKKLRAKGAIISRDGGPYRISRRGLELVRGELDNR